MAHTWTTTELLAAVRAYGRLSEDDPDATDANLLLEADRQMETVFVPVVRKARSDFYVTWEDQDLVASQAGYRIPWRATGGVVRRVCLYDTSNLIERAELMPVALDQITSTSGEPTCYAIRDDQVILDPKPVSATYDLRIYYERRPSTLVVASSAGAIATISSQSSTSLVVPTSTLSTIASGDLADVVCRNPPFSLYVSGATATVAAGSITIAKGTQDRTVAVGDYLCEVGETPIPQIPAELHPHLAKATAARYLLPIDRQAAADLIADMQAGLASAVALLTPRQIGRQQKMKSTNSLLRRGNNRRRGGFSDFTP